MCLMNAMGRHSFLDADAMLLSTIGLLKCEQLSSHWNWILFNSIAIYYLNWSVPVEGYAFVLHITLLISKLIWLACLCLLWFTTDMLANVSYNPQRQVETVTVVLSNFTRLARSVSLIEIHFILFYSGPQWYHTTFRKLSVSPRNKTSLITKSKLIRTPGLLLNSIKI